MSEKYDISVINGVSLVTLNAIPAGADFLGRVFATVCDCGINVDMISQTPPQGQNINLSFTVADENISELLQAVNKLDSSGSMASAISAGNCKINLSGEAMSGSKGVAARFFACMARVSVGAIMITTSEVDISVLVPHDAADALAQELSREFA